MLRNRKYLSLVSLVVLAVFLFTACSSNTGNSASGGNTQSSGTNQKISLAAASPGGTLYILGSTISKILKDKNGIEVSVESTGGALSNQQLLEENNSTFGIITTDISYDAWNGTGTWNKGKPLKNVRTVLPLYVLQLQMIAREDANINKLSDMNGKVVAAGPAGSAHDTLARKIFEIFDIKPSKILNLTFDDTADQIRDKKADALIVVSSAPNSTLTNISTTIDAVMVSFSDEEIKKIVEEMPYFKPYTIPANTYKDQDKDCATVTQWGFFAVNKDQPDELVYQVTKAVAENWDVMEGAVNSTKGVKPQDVQSLNLPVHPGAMKYLEEIGVDIPAALQPPAE
ncbi:MAG: TAXI family TRAP transporter solute-binding subunit [Clostridiaceae bacterium]|nr:TAXI family TRAP transporter solute-binding subunit [Clostridiaceae bacterium]